jgi:hypothetical protein
MIAKSSGVYGDRISLRSPLHRSADCSESSTLSFQYYVQQDEVLKIGGLEVVALSEHRVPVRTLLTWKELFAHEWVRTEVELPNVSFFYIVFVAVLGKPFASDVLIDDVTVNCVPRRETKPGRSVFVAVLSFTLILL